MRLSFGGTLGDPGMEIWSNTLRWFVIEPAPSAATLQEACDAAVAPISAWIASPESKISRVVSLDWVKLNWVKIDGTQRDQNTVRSDVTPVVRNPSGTGGVPWYQTQAITLRTALARGRSHAGRIFPPVVGSVIDIYSPYDQAAGGLKVAAFRTMLVDLRTAMGAVLTAAGGTAPDLAIFSPGSIAKGTTPLSSIVTGIELDLLPDVQHRRTNRVPRNAFGPTPL